MPELPPQDRATKAQLPILQEANRRLSRRTRERDVRPHAGPSEEGEGSALSGKSGTLRAAIFGLNDGLVSNVALIMGFAGAGQDRSVILLAGISGLLAGAFSMGAGEYISMRVQRELLERLLHLEAHELGTDPDGERHELAAIYIHKGLAPELAEQVAGELMRDPVVALDTHAREELGIDPTEGLGSPWGAATSSFLTFAAGALVPIVPFMFGSGTAGAVTSATITGLALLGVGGLTSRLTGRRVWLSALRMFAIGAAAAAVTFGIGMLLGVSVVG
jgi:vacuolar iron transporter family protein